MLHINDTRPVYDEASTLTVLESAGILHKVSATSEDLPGFVKTAAVDQQQGIECSLSAATSVLSDVTYRQKASFGISSAP
jgi:hypothetical protein